MPLTFKRPSRADFLPLIEKIERRLEGWQGRLISRAGRLLLQNSVLASIPLHYMTCFILPKWVLNRIDVIRRQFLWGKTGNKRGISLLNWGLVCTPKSCGGLGAVNLEVRNLALILRWWWKVQTEKEGLWASIAIALRAIHTQTDGVLIWGVKGSFFWGQLIKWRHLYQWSVQITVGNGNSISFWYDSWGENPLRRLKDGLPRPSLQNISLYNGWPIRHDLVPELLELDIQLSFNSQQEDGIVWRWSANGEYSAGSIYKVMQMAGRLGWRFEFIWKVPTPPKVKVFTYLHLKKRILTHDVMARRGIRCDLHCAMCETCPLESALHLFYHCRYAKQVWEEVARRLGRRIMVRGQSVQQTWDQSWDYTRQEGVND